MEKSQVVRDFISSLEAGDMEKAGKCLTDNFNFVIPMPFPMGKNQVLTFLQLVSTSMPDINYNLDNVNESGDKVTVTLRPSGTHTVDFTVPIPGMRAIPASGQNLTLPETQVEFSISEDKISEMKLVTLPLGNISGMMKNMGMDLPGMN